MGKMEEIIKCKECDRDFDSLESLHHHLKAHKIKTADYYIKHLNKKDRYSNDLIPFKTLDQYLETDFISKTNLRLWLKGQGKEVQKEYCVSLLKKRKEKKSLVYAPTQIELRSLPIPAVNYYNQLFGDYNKLCESLGLKIKFGGSLDSFNYPSIKDKVKNILCDSREQRKLEIDFPIEITKLDFGDYALDNPELNENVYIERKSLGDFIGSFGQGLERITSELERAAISNAYIVILVEDTIEHVLAFDHLPYVHAKVKPDLIFHNIRQLLQRYDCFQFVFAHGRVQAARILKRILFEKGLARNLDLGLLTDLGLL